MTRRLKDYAESMSNKITTAYSDVIDLTGAKTLSVQAIVDVNTPAAKTFTAAITDICTSAANGFTTGLKVQLTTTTTLPGGLSLLTDYFVIVLTTTTFKLASSLVNAQAGTAVDITDTGTGTHTITPVALAAATISLQKSNDNTTYDDVTTATAVTVDADVWFEKVDPEYKYARVKVTMTAGSISTVLNVVTKG